MTLDVSGLPSLRVATYNMLHSNVTHPQEEVLPRVSEGAEHLKDVQVVFLQEVEALDGEVLTSEVLAGMLGMEVASDGLVGLTRLGRPYYTSIITNLPVLWASTISIAAGDRDFPVAVVRAPSGRPFLLTSVHLSWGSGNAGVRTRQMIEVTSKMTSLAALWAAQHGVEPVCVVGGDFNSDPESETVRVATGQASYDDGKSFKWTEAMEVVGQENWVGPVSTMQPRVNELAQRTALAVGITHPMFLPDRRIDYVMVLGWAFGRPGCPVRGETRGHVPAASGVLASDHNIVVVDLLDLPL